MVHPMMRFFKSSVGALARRRLCTTGVSAVCSSLLRVAPHVSRPEGAVQRICEVGPPYDKKELLLADVLRHERTS